ncbi:hypothetical protein [Streptomyces sp. cg35]|uniref:hypothetical protein n=1 Tax=Streptomyces sp. cg35 TaxID=3421650 RepID=UPI003D1692BA
MAIRTSAELMAWQPPAEWDGLSGDERRSYLHQHGMPTTLTPSDWDTLDREQRGVFVEWRFRILCDTPESLARDRAFKEGEYREGLSAWSAMTIWWCLCLTIAVVLIWGLGTASEHVGLRIGGTVFVVIGYALAVYVPMRVAKPCPPQP